MIIYHVSLKIDSGTWESERSWSLFPRNWFMLKNQKFKGIYLCTLERWNWKLEGLVGE